MVNWIVQGTVLHQQFCHTEIIYFVRFDPSDLSVLNIILRSTGK
jgi:hypothetical protein